VGYWAGLACSNAGGVCVCVCVLAVCPRCGSSLSVGRRGRMSGMKGIMCPMGGFGCGVCVPG